MRVNFIKHCFGLITLSFCMQSHAIEVYGEQAKQIKISGEQVIHEVPDGWELAYFKGDPDADFIMEYVPKGDDVHQWKNGYLLIQRVNYPEASILEKLKSAKISIAEAVVLQTQDNAMKGCGGKFEAMSQGATTFNQVPAYVSGGYCSRYSKIAPYGEGAVVSVMEGKEKIFKMQYSWRPQSAQPQLKWGLANSQITNYLNRMKNTKLCGGTNAQTCNH